MFIRMTTSRRGSKTYRYPQLVESYRKPNGTPTHRVLCSLKGLSDVAVDNLRAAFEAGRKGQAVVLEPEAADALRSVMAEANLRYLDVAVAYELWRQLGLDSLLAELLPHTEAKVRAEEVIAALVIHRCTAPGSKLAAARWYPRTALPELQHIAPGRFHNTRVHRTLDSLDQVEAQLQARLPEHLRAEQGSFVSLFLDITDTWFEGRGPAMAYDARTKEGLLRHKIGLALLCDQRGFPLRWETLPGNYYEARAMGTLVEQVAALDWAHEVPVVLDRMMGTGKALAQLAGTGVRFVTALPVSEFDSWTSKVPWQPLAEVVLSGTQADANKDLARLEAAAKRAKLKKVHSDRWVLDLGVATRTDLGADARQDSSAGPIAQAMRRCAAMKADLDAEVVRSTNELAEHEGVSPRSIRRYLQLARLAPAVQRRVLAGEAEGLGITRLCAIARRPARRQLHLDATTTTSRHPRARRS